MKSLCNVALALFFITACTSDYLTRLGNIEQIVYENPEEALDSIRKLGPEFPRMNAKEQAYYSLLNAMAIDKSYIDTTDASILDPAISYYSKHGSPREKMLTYFYLGRIQENSRQYGDALITLTQALEQDWGDNAYRGRVYMAMADAYMANYNMHEEARCVDSASVYFNLTGDSSLVRIAIFRRAADLIYQKSYIEARQALDELLQCHELDYRLKRNCLQKNAYVTALLDDNSRFQQALSYYGESIELGRGLSTSDAACYAYMLYMTGHKDMAMSMFESLESKNGSSRAKAQSWRSRLDYHEGKMESAFLLQERALNYQDSVVVATLNQSLLATQRDYYADRALREQQYSKLLKTRHTVVLLSIALIAFLFLAMALYARRKTVQKVGQYESTLEELKNELFLQTEEGDISKQQIASLREQFRRVYRHHFDLLANFYEEYDIQRRKSIPEEERNRQILHIIDGLRGETESDNRFEKIVDEDMNGIMTSFRNDFPGFSEQDYRLFCYYVAGFTTKTISIIISGLSADAIYMRKSRMKKIIENSDCLHKDSYLEYL